MFETVSSLGFLARRFPCGVQRHVTVLLFFSLASLLSCGGSSTTPATTSVTYTIGGTISGLTGSGLVLQDNSGNNLSVSAGATTFTFTTAITSGSTYNVTVLTQPSSPAQNCVVTSGGSGTASANVTNVLVTCTTLPTYTIGGTISGLSGTGLVLQDNSGNNLSVSAGATTFTFTTAIVSGGAYNVTVLTQPSSPVQNCVVTSGGSGTASANVTSVVISCTATSGNTVTGTASLGAPIVGASLTLKDANGSTSTGTTASGGTFTLNTGGLTPPFLIKLVTAISSGSFPAGTTLYSVSADANATTHINVHVLSDFIVRSYFNAQGIDPDTAFSNPVANPAPSPLAVQIISGLVIQTMQVWLNNAGVTVTPGAPSSTSINLISSTFTANGTGLDAALQSIASETLNSTNGSVTGITVSNTGGTVTETISPTYAGGDITVNTTTTNSSTNTTTAGSFSSAPPTSSAAQTDLSAIVAQLTSLENTINADSATLTGSNLMSFYAIDYLNDGDNAATGAAALAANVHGLTVDSYQIENVKSLNTTNNTADIVVSYTISLGALSPSGTTEYFLKQEGGTWLLYGDQRIAQVLATAEARSTQGGGSGGSTATRTDIDATVQAPHGVVTTATVSGGGTIWGSATSGSLTEGAQFIQNGQSFDNFILLSNNLGTNISQVPKPGTQFTFSLTTTASGSPQYTVPSNNFTTDAVSFSGINNASGNGPLSNVVGKTLTYSWSLPTTFAIGDVSLFAYIYDGSPLSPTTHSCSIGANSGTSVTSTSGSITFPANMAPCGESGTPITNVDVYLEVDGVNGEVSINALNYPY